MAVRRLSLVLDLDSGQFSTRITDATGKLRTFDTEVRKAGTGMSSLGRHAQASLNPIDALNRKIWGLQITLYSVTFLFGGFTAGLVKMNMEAQRSIALLEGLSKKTSEAGRRADAAADFKYLREFSKNAPFSLEALTDTFVKLKSAGIDPTAGAMQALTNGVARFGGNSEVLKRAAVAIQQMSGKGVISMEELRQQLGEAMPDAVRIMARAAGMGVQEFVAQVSKGKVQAKGILEKFWVELEKEAAGSSERLMNTLGGQVSKIKTNLQTLALAVGGFMEDGSFAKGGFMDTLVGGAKDFNSWLTDPATIKGAQEFGHTLAVLLTDVKDFVGFVAANYKTIALFGGAFMAWANADAISRSIRAFSLSLAGLNGKLEGLVSKTQAARVAQMGYTAAAIQGGANIAAQAATEAVMRVDAQRASNAAIESTIALLREEAAAYEANIALAERQKIAAREAAFAAQGRKNRGVGEFGALSPAGAGSVGKNAKDAIDAEKAIIANRQQLSRVTAEIAEREAVLSSGRVALVAGEVAAANAIARTTIAAKAGQLAFQGLTGVLDLLGGPVIGSLLISLGGLALMVNSTNKMLRKMSESEQQLADDTQAANKAMEDAEQAIGVVDEVSGLTKKTTDELAKAMQTAQGDVKGLTAQLIIQAEAYRRVTIEALRARAAALGVDLDAERRRNIQAGDKPKVKRQLRGPIGEPGARAAAAGSATVGLGSDDYVDRAASEGQKRQDAIQKQINALNAEAEKVRTAPTKVLASNLPGAEVDKPSTGSGGKNGKKPKESPAEKLDDSINKLEATRDGLLQLIDTMDEGSDAAEQMRANIENIRSQGGTITPEQEQKAIQAARDADRLKKAYDAVSSVFRTGREQSLAASEAFATLGDSTNATEASVQKFARNLAESRAEIIRLDPELAKDTARLEKLDGAIEKATDDYRFVKLAEAVRGLNIEMDDLGRHHIDPNLQAWDAFTDKIKEMDDLLAEANKLPAGKERDKTISQITADRQKYTDNYVRQLQFSLSEEIRANREALMTEEDARKAAHDREIERIIEMTDISKLNDEERAKYGAQMAQQRADAIAAADARLARDLETPTQKMAREWGDMTTVMKQMQGDWMDDFYEKIKTGEMNFGDFVLKMLEDYLWAIFKAKTASMTASAMDGFANMLGNALGSMFSGGGFMSTADDGSWGMTFANVHHNGGIAGAFDRQRRQVPAAMFLGAPRYHNGGIAGLKPDEVPAILQKGEPITSLDQVRNGKTSSAPNVQVNVINESGQALDAEQGGGRFDGEQYIVDVVVNHMGRRGPLRDAMRAR